MADGQVLIDTKINTAGVLKGTEAIEKDLKRTAEVTLKAAKTIEEGFSDKQYKKAFKKLPEAAQEAYAQIELIRADDAKDNEAKAKKIAKVFESLGDDQVLSQKRAWAIIEAESTDGSHKIIDDLQDISKQAKKTADSMSDQFKDVFGAGLLSDLVSNAFDNVGDFLVDSARQAVEAAADIAAANAMFEQTFKGVEKTAREALKSISDETKMSVSRLQGPFAKIFSYVKAVGGDMTTALSISERAIRAAADAAAYHNMTLEDATDRIYSYLKGNYEASDALNVASTETLRNSAANDRYAKSFDKLSESQKVDTLLSMIETSNELSGALGQASREASEWANITGELSEAWRQFIAVFGESAIEKLTPVLQFITNDLNRYVELRRELEAKNNPVAEEFTEIAEAAEPAVDAIDEIAETYAKAKEAARDSIDSQIGYFEEISLESDITAQKIIENWQKQQEAFSGYTANLQKAVDMGIDESLIKQFSDGSTQSMIYLNALVNDASVTVEEINAQWAGLNQIRDTTAGVMAGIQEDIAVATVETGESVGQLVSTAGQGSADTLADASNSIQTTVLTPLQESAAETGEMIGESFSNAADTMKSAWSDTGTWFDDNVSVPVRRSMEDISKDGVEMWIDTESATKQAWANMVEIVENAVSKMQTSINGLTGKTVTINVDKTGSGANSIRYSGYDGQAYSPEMDYAPAVAAYTPATFEITPQIPYLATGAVIPPMAISSAFSRPSGISEDDMDTFAQKFAQIMEDNGGTIEVHNYLEIGGELAPLIRMLYPKFTAEAHRRGKSLAIELIQTP